MEFSLFLDVGFGQCFTRLLQEGSRRSSYGAGVLLLPMWVCLPYRGQRLVPITGNMVLQEQLRKRLITARWQTPRVDPPATQNQNRWFLCLYLHAPFIYLLPAVGMPLAFQALHPNPAALWLSPSTPSSHCCVCFKVQEQKLDFGSVSMSALGELSN